MNAHDHRFVESAPTWPLHASPDPEEQDSPWSVEPETPASVLWDMIDSTWGKGHQS